MKVIVRRFFATLLSIAMMMSFFPGVMIYADNTYTASAASYSVGSDTSLHIKKTITEGADGYTLTVESYASGTEWKQTPTSLGLDVVLIIDSSAEMGNRYNSDTTISRMDYMKSFVAYLTEVLSQDAHEYNTNHRIAAVSFSDEASVILEPTIVNGNEEEIKNKVNSLTPTNGARHVEKGVETAYNKFYIDDNLNESLNFKLFLLCTCGYPTDTGTDIQNAIKAIDKQISSDSIEFGIDTLLLSDDDELGDYYEEITSELFSSGYGFLSLINALSHLFISVPSTYYIELFDDEYFELDPSNCSIKTASIKPDGSGWMSPTPYPDITPTDVVYRREIRTTGFDYCANSIHKTGSEWTGKKLIITVKLKPVDSDYETDSDTVVLKGYSAIYCSGNILIRSLPIIINTHGVEYMWAGNYPEDLAVPTEPNRYLNGATYNVTYSTNTVIDRDSYGNEKGRYTLESWSDVTVKITDSDITIIGTWTYTDTPRDEYSITYKWSGDIPTGVNTPTDSTVYYNNMPYTVDKTYTSKTDIIENISDYEHNHYTFSGWKLEGKYATDTNIKGASVEFTGVWKKSSVIDPHVKVKYSWTGAVPALCVTPTSFGTNKSFDVDPDDRYYKDALYPNTYDLYGNVTGQHRFSGWYLDGNLVEGNYTPSDMEKTGNDTLEFKGTWTHENVTPTSYFVKYQWKDTIYPVSAKTPTDTKVYVNNQPYTVSDLYKVGNIVYLTDTDNKVVGKYTFKGWNKSNGKINGSDVVITGSWVYKKAGSEKYTITFEAGNYGKIREDTDDSFSTKSISDRLKVYSEFPEAPETKANSGYEFVGWSDEFGQLFDEDNLPKYVTKDMTLTAQWKKKNKDFVHNVAYNVEYYLENSKGKYVLEDTKTLYAEIDTKVYAEILDYDGYDYNSSLSDRYGWTYLTPANNEEDDPEVLVLQMYYDLESSKTYTIKFLANKNGKLNGDTKDITYTCKSEDKFPTVPTTKANNGYEFSYWKDSAGKKVTAFPTKVTESETYTAVWGEKEDNPNTGSEGTYVIGIMAAAAALAFVSGRKRIK